MANDEKLEIISFNIWNYQIDDANKLADKHNISTSKIARAIFRAGLNELKAMKHAEIKDYTRE